MAGSQGFGPVALVGVEGTGCYGAGLTRHLHGQRIAVVEVDRPNRQRRRRKGKSDPEDAISAAHAAHSGDARGLAKTRDGDVESMRVLRVARISARNATDPGAQPDAQPDLDGTRRPARRAAALNVYRLLERTSSYPPRHQARRRLAHQVLAADAGSSGDRPEVEIDEIDAILKPLVKQTAPELVAQRGRHRRRLGAPRRGRRQPRAPRNEAAFAHLCGTSPIDASSGKQQRHRLNRSGDRQANSALWHVVFTRMVSDPRTIEYFARRMKEGKTKKEAMRCLKRYVARELFPLLPRQIGP